MVGRNKSLWTQLRHGVPSLFRVFENVSSNSKIATRRWGLVPYLRNRFGVLTRNPLQDRVRGPSAHEGGLGLVDSAISTPNLLRHFGTSPNVAGQQSNKMGLLNLGGGRSCSRSRKRSFWIRSKREAMENVPLPSSSSRRST